MGIYDRDYIRNRRTASSPVRARVRMWSFTTWLIVINIAVFVIDALLARSGQLYRVGPMAMGPLEYFGYFSVDTALYGGQAWRLVTFQFLHAGIGHIFFNMLALYFFGPMVEQYLGSRRYLGFYLLCGVAGAAALLALWALNVLVTHPAVPMVGASAGVFGILIAAARIAPNTRVMLLFPPIPMSLRTLAWVLLGIAVFVVLTGRENAGGEAAHLGGAVLGFILIRKARWLDVFDRFRLPRGGGGAARLTHRPGARSRKVQQQTDLDREVDRILDKVHREGMQSLSSREKRTLREASETKRGG